MRRSSTTSVFDKRRYVSSLSSWLKGALVIPGIGVVDYIAADREISRNRILIALAGLIYSIIMRATHKFVDEPTIEILGVYLIISILLAYAKLTSAWLLYVRRGFALTLDIVGLSVAFATAGIFAAPAFLLYLWLVIGYGFRYGIRFLRLASGGGVVGFVTAASASPYWSQQPYLITSFAATLLIIPVYIELLLRKILIANERAKDANHAKALMLAGLGFELRAPLGSIASSAEHLLRTRLELVQIDMVESIQVATKSLRLELDDFLEVSRIEAGRRTLRLTYFATTQAVKDALQMVAADAEAKGLRMSWHISSMVPVKLKLDRAHFTKALTNLLNNAVKFTNAGSISVYITLVEGQRKGLTIRGEVSDTGIGVERDAKEKIWQSFTQANRRVVQSYGGAGLGLSVARQLIESMGGSVGVESKLGEGSTFWFQIPIPTNPDALPAEEWPQGLAVVLVSPCTAETPSLIQCIRDHGGQVFHADQIRNILPAVSLASDDVERFVIMIDGREGDAVQVAYALRFDAAFTRVPMILIRRANRTISAT